MPPRGLAMRLRDRVGLNFPPLLLRLALGVIFLFAGVVKITQTMDVSGQAAADLANLGVLAAPNTAPATVPPTATPPEKKPGAMGPATEPQIALARQTPRTFTAADFPSPVKVRLAHGLTLALLGAAHPGNTPEGTAKMPLWPPALAQGNWAVYMAWAATLTEAVGGAALLAGFFTRFFALGIAFVMLTAMWLTQIGPAIQAGNARFGFLPNYPIVDEHWSSLFLQFALMMSALALLFLGPGRASLDNVLFSKGSEDDDEETE